MQLTKAEKEKVSRWINTRCPNFFCPACETKPSDWNLGDLVQLEVTPAERVPVVCINCNVCGYLACFSAVVMGIRQPGRRARSARER